MTEVISSPMLSSLGFVRFAMSTRKGGASAEPYGMNLSYKVGDARENVLANRSKLFEHLGIQQERLALPKQCHSARVVKVDTGGEYESCDGLATATPGIWLGISIADCLPVVLADPKCKAVAVLHAGWRGTMQGIVRNGVAALSDAFESKPEDMVAFLGPSASACCYEVGVEVAERFSASVLQRRNGLIFLDLKTENTHQLREAGVLGERIETSLYCTICSTELLHSFRRDGEKSGRMMALAGILS